MGFAENIKRLREEHHLTQAQLGNIAGVSNKAISTWENGTAYPRIGAIERIAAYYHLLKSDLVDDRDGRSENATKCYFMLFLAIFCHKPHY